MPLSPASSEVALVDGRIYVGVVEIIPGAVDVVGRRRRVVNGLVELGEPTHRTWPLAQVREIRWST